MEEHVKMLLALAWTSFDKPLWQARREMQDYLEKNFELRKALPSNEGLNGRMPTFF